MSPDITIEHGARSVTVGRANHDSAQKILGSALLKQELGFPEGSVVKDEYDNVISGGIPAGVDVVRVERQAGGKN
jgi:hypothetical protein